MRNNNPQNERKLWLKQKLAEEKNRFDVSGNGNRKRAWSFALAGLIASSVTTVLVGFKGLPESGLLQVNNLALLSSVGVTIVAGLNAFYNYREVWVRYTAAWAQLRSIELELEFLLASKSEPSDDELESLFRQFRRSLDEADASWIEIRNAKK